MKQVLMCKLKRTRPQTSTAKFEVLRITSSTDIRDRIDDLIAAIDAVLPA